MPPNAAITGWASYLPEAVLTNHELAQRAHTTGEWICSRTGIRERRVAAPNETTSSMCVAAGRRALDRAGLSAKDLDLVICATTTPDHLMPATACLVQHHLGAVNAGAFDVNAACTGFLCGFITAAQFIRAGTYERVLVVAGETLTRFLDWTDRSTAPLFGDGAGAVVLEVTGSSAGILATTLGCQGDVAHALAIEAGAGAKPASAQTLARGEHFLRMRGNEVFRLAVRGMSRAAAQVLAQSRLSPDQIRAVIPHQANLRIITAMQEAVGLRAEQVVVTVDRWGNTGSASVPMALAEHLDAGGIREGEHLLLVAFGGGLTWAAAVVRWAAPGRVPGT
jgi:3-oxoacyl-[acyl-carrier-protein] synthase-3